jgi:23S rRNA (pseudouridine1915-N3)-methyltransferase
MKIHLLAVGTRMPGWVVSRLSPNTRNAVAAANARCTWSKFLPASAARRLTMSRAFVRIEGERLLAAIPGGSCPVALDERGQQWSTLELAAQLTGWLRDGRDVSLLVGGPDGLDAPCRARAERHWSLSRLTLPHPLVRVLIAEQLYRAWSLLHNHPYHRA